MTERTFVSADGDTVTAWRAEVAFDASNKRRPVPLTPYWKSPVSLHLLDFRSGLSWLCVASKPPYSSVCSTFSLAPAPYLGALSTVLSDLLTEESDR